MFVWQTYNVWYHFWKAYLVWFWYFDVSNESAEQNPACRGCVKMEAQAQALRTKGSPTERKSHLGIAQIAIGPPHPHSNGHSVAPIFGQNHANARLYMDIIPKNRCHKPSWQGFRPPHPNGQCPNEQRFFYSGASLSLWTCLLQNSDNLLH